MVSLPLTGAVGAVGLVVGVVAGFVVGNRRSGAPASTPDRPDGPSELANALDTEATTRAVRDAVDDLVGAVDTVIDETPLRSQGAVPATASPSERARALEDAVRNGRIRVVDADRDSTADGPADDSRSSVDRPAGQSRSTVDAAADAGNATLAGAVATVRSRTGPSTQPSRRLLDYLEAPADVAETQLTDTLETVVGAVDAARQYEEALSAVGTHATGRELADQLRSQARQLDAEYASVLGHVASEYDTVVRDLEQCRDERDSLVTTAERVVDVARKQAAISTSKADSPGQQLDRLGDALESGSVSITESTDRVDHVADRVKERTRPESALAHDFLDGIGADEFDSDYERTLADVVEAVDRAETVTHRLDGVAAEDVERLADRLAEELRSVEPPYGPLLRDRVVELGETLSRASDSDPVTVYATRQELRFYDRELLPELQSDTDQTERVDVDSLLDSVEQRRSTMRTEYPTRYPDHDHSIPIHFLELVEQLHDEAAVARDQGRVEEAVGRLEAAEATLDWVEELYERTAFSALLEQLRG